MSTRVIVWLGLLAAVGLGVWQLSVLFPGQLTSDLDQAYVIQSIVLIALISAGVVFARRVKMRKPFATSRSGSLSPLS